MFVKRGDANPITVIDPVDVDHTNTKKALKKALIAVKEIENKIVAAKLEEKN
jgi:hypothetical protein